MGNPLLFSCWFTSFFCSIPQAPPKRSHVTVNQLHYKWACAMVRWFANFLEIERDHFRFRVDQWRSSSAIANSFTDQYTLVEIKNGFIGNSVVLHGFILCSIQIDTINANSDSWFLCEVGHDFDSFNKLIIIWFLTFRTDCRIDSASIVNRRLG